MSRLRELEARRRVLLERCQRQRAELAERVAGLRAGVFFGARALPRLRQPLAWAAALAGLMLLGRAREALTLVVWVRTALSLASRATQLLRTIAQLRESRAARPARAAREVRTR
ncbi:MAG TPA: hypothetical protein VFK87_13315 [Steroidobacteraceae bacterium]|nr:hypothetical protein [Steroidobacteraceae bacterium]